MTGLQPTALSAANPSFIVFNTFRVLNVLSVKRAVKLHVTNCALQHLVQHMPTLVWFEGTTVNGSLWAFKYANWLVGEKLQNQNKGAFWSGGPLIFIRKFKGTPTSRFNMTNY